MICPKCGCLESLVVDSRKREAYNNRRRECIGCGYIFRTVEITEINEKNLTRLKIIMQQNDKPRQFEKMIHWAYMKYFQRYQFRKMKGLKQDENRSSKDE